MEAFDCEGGYELAVGEVLGSVFRGGSKREVVGVLSG